ncbi:MAG TPA: F0F1 ATP synthase subunit delta [Candidatus Omnitrophota bacterium]|nr:F0F1 ATP synthase subunit delta [Candidatus Omnitrophota bacterium]HPD85120.1 F0F1 ATP synthase subunit delta [Candidatus Omnitrophota bacterium]HRZ03978.1 F0F1 ATP synthase subunit delta [Candidatus Omnitrophota bacterium]
MAFVFILMIFLFQVVLALVIVWILKVLLNRQLIEITVRSFEMADSSCLEQDTNEITVIAYGKISEDIKQRISDAFYKKTRRTANLIVMQDKAIKGGIVIKQKKIIADGSLHDRLKRSGMLAWWH